MGTDMAKHTPGHMVNQVAGLGQEGQEDLHHYLHPWWLLGVCKMRETGVWAGRCCPILGPCCAQDVPCCPHPKDNDSLVALERVRRVFSPRLFSMQVWMSPRRSQLSVGDCG